MGTEELKTLYQVWLKCREGSIVSFTLKVLLVQWCRGSQGGNWWKRPFKADKTAFKLCAVGRRVGAKIKGVVMLKFLQFTCVWIEAFAQRVKRFASDKDEHSQDGIILEGANNSDHKHFMSSCSVLYKIQGLMSSSPQPKSLVLLFFSRFTKAEMERLTDFSKVSELEREWARMRHQGSATTVIVSLALYSCSDFFQRRRKKSTKEVKTPYQCAWVLCFLWTPGVMKSIDPRQDLSLQGRGYVPCKMRGLDQIISEIPSGFYSLWFYDSKQRFPSSKTKFQLLSQALKRKERKELIACLCKFK